MHKQMKHSFADHVYLPVYSASQTSASVTACVRCFCLAFYRATDYPNICNILPVIVVLSKTFCRNISCENNNLVGWSLRKLIRHQTHAIMSSEIRFIVVQVYYNNEFRDSFTYRAVYTCVYNEVHIDVCGEKEMKANINI